MQLSATVCIHKLTRFQNGSNPEKPESSFSFQRKCHSISGQNKLVPALALPFLIRENFRSYLASPGFIYKMKGHHRDQTHGVVVNIK